MTGSRAAGRKPGPSLALAPKVMRPITKARSTVLIASRASVHAAGHGEQYEAALDPVARAALGALAFDDANEGRS
jgi:hypothetical protein